MRVCIICDEPFFATMPTTSCACGSEISREMALALPTKVLTEKRRRWLLFPELVRRENLRRRYLAAEVAKASKAAHAD